MLELEQGGVEGGIVALVLDAAQSVGDRGPVAVEHGRDPALRQAEADGRDVHGHLARARDRGAALTVPDVAGGNAEADGDQVHGEVDAGAILVELALARLASVDGAGQRCGPSIRPDLRPPPAGGAIRHEREA